MTKRYFCDRCGIEIEPVTLDFDEMFEDVSFNLEKKEGILRPQLCKKCNKGYNKLMKETNNRIKEFLKEKN